jgi:hypothetical protein
LDHVFDVQRQRWLETLAQKRGVLIVGRAGCSPVSGVATA